MGKGHAWSVQSQELILNLIEYFQREKKNGGPVDSVDAVQERVAHALKICKGTVARISVSGIASPKLTKTRRAAKTKDVTDEQKAEIRNIIDNMYYEGKEVSLGGLATQLKETGVLEISRSSLSVLMHSLGYKFSKDPISGCKIWSEAPIKKAKKKTVATTSLL